MNTNNVNKNNSGGSKMLISAALGAAFGAAAVVLSDRKKREKIKKAVDEIITKGNQQIDRIRETAEIATDKGRKILNDELDKQKHLISKKSE
ncbi:MAG: hypothetical protein UV73_C0003G0080 [Candidatus Gottesmanbacteria bacterium GW2011_GWA2_43_14]|uniref:Uncharacterized protein n=1 Tax=Candidatus Gottesmanbacteria bacterium GW2011_GWA2_43_14 TaxID=1618443 RepID=A0A0G1GH78_9BACT|nr:MAG: hypothetical protein UV73_C0003G0080 [Candidatus Gottesmanbacteria bacterium GW2011_GWA2_43_14]